MVLDRLRVLEVEDVLLHSGEHMILAPHIGEPRGHVARVVDIDAAARHEPEDRGELADAQQQDEHEVQDRRQRVEDGGRRLEHALYRRRVVDEPEEHRHDGDHDQPLDGARQPEPGVVAHLVRDLIAAAEYTAGQPVVAGVTARRGGSSAGAAPPARAAGRATAQSPICTCSCWRAASEKPSTGLFDIWYQTTMNQTPTNSTLNLIRSQNACGPAGRPFGCEQAVLLAPLPARPPVGLAR